MAVRGSDRRASEAKGLTFAVDHGDPPQAIAVDLPTIGKLAVSSKLQCIAEKVALGLKDAEIANVLGKSPYTVSKQVAELRRHFAAKSRFHLVAKLYGVKNHAGE